MDAEDFSCTRLLELLVHKKLECEVKPQRIVSEICSAIKHVSDHSSLRQVIECLVFDNLIRNKYLDGNNIAEYMLNKRESTIVTTMEQLMNPLERALGRIDESVLAYRNFRESIRWKGTSSYELKFMDQDTPISRNVKHRYTHTPTITSKPIYEGKTYCQLNGLAPLACPSSKIGNHDTNNHAFLVLESAGDEVREEYIKRRIIVSRLNNLDFAKLALQVAAKRTKMLNNEAHVDETFAYLLRTFRGQSEPLSKEPPYPSCMSRHQQSEAIFAYITLHVLTRSTDEERRVAKEVLDFYLHGGAYVTITKHFGWNQNPQKSLKRRKTETS